MASIEPSAKLTLVEFLLKSGDVSESARQGLEWLRLHAGVRQALCAVATGDAEHLWGVAGIGISPARTGAFVVDIRDRRHPLVVAALTGRPATFGPGRGRPDTPLDSRMPFHVLPMRPDSQAPPVGLVLVQGLQPRPDRDLLWFAGVLGAKLRRLRMPLLASDRGIDRERQLLFSIINAVSDPILLTDAHGKLILGNARAEELLATERESEGHRHALELNNLYFSSALASSTLGGPDAGAREVVLVDPEDGSDLLFELITTPVHRAGQQSAFVSVLRNVTDLGRAAQELEENYRRLRHAEAKAHADRHRIELVIDSVVDPIVVSEPSGDILMTNKPAESLFSTRDQSARAQRHVRANAAQFSSFTAGVLMSGQPDRIRTRMTLADPESGRPVPVEAVAAVVPGESDFVAVVTVLHDLSEALERERLFEELKQASELLEARVLQATAELAQHNDLLRSQAEELKRASAAKSQFLASISHEFRTPLNAILGYVWLLRQSSSNDADAEARRMLGKIESNSRHLATLINDVLDITRIEANQMPVQETEFEVSDLVAEVLEELEALVTRGPVPITVDCSGMRVVLSTDRQKLKQIVINLLTNAVKFTREGHIRIEAWSSADDRCRIAVRDTGVGIPAADQARIFEAFEQGATSRRPATGTGLGLAIARRLAALLGGQVQLESTVGVGSTFTVEIPTRLPKAPVERPAAKASAPEPSIRGVPS